jgi:hypothetical protein
MYGNIQAMWKHRRMFFNPRYNWLGMVTLPFAAISVLLPVLFLPFIYAMLVVIAITQGAGAVLFYFTVFTLGQVLSALVAVALTRERPTVLFVAPLYRLIYEPLRAYVVYRSVLTVLKGDKVRMEEAGAHWRGFSRAPRLMRPEHREAEHTACAVYISNS